MNKPDSFNKPDSSPRRTKKQAEASRANGRKSRGPKTLAGKLRSALNSMSHGLTSGTVVLTAEDPQEYAALRSAYLQRFQPADTVEAEAVDAMVLARWYLRRAAKAETALVDVTMDLQDRKIARKFDRVDLGIIVALAIKKLYDRSTSLANVQRHAARLQRDFQRALNELRSLRSDPLLNPAQPLDPPKEKVQIEPGDSQPPGIQ